MPSPGRPVSDPMAFAVRRGSGRFRLGRASAIAWSLVNDGWSRGTPVAVVSDASTPRQQVWRGTLDELGAGIPAAQAASLGTIVIGDVVNVNMQATLDRAVAYGS